MQKSKSFPVYSAETILNIMPKLSISDCGPGQLARIPDRSRRGIIVWYPGFSIGKQNRLLREHPFHIQKQLRVWSETASAKKGYYRVCLPAPGTGGLTTACEEAIVAPHGEGACPVPVATWTWLIHLVATGESLGFGNAHYMRCQEDPFAAFRVALSPGALNLWINPIWDLLEDERIQLASAGLAN